jgi:hypothetical protein
LTRKSGVVRLIPTARQAEHVKVRQPVLSDRSAGLRPALGEDERVSAEVSPAVLTVAIEQNDVSVSNP